jgi:hypothetical protein
MCHGNQEIKQRVKIEDHDEPKRKTNDYNHDYNSLKDCNSESSKMITITGD